MALLPVIATTSCIPSTVIHVAPTPCQDLDQALHYLQVQLYDSLPYRWPHNTAWTEPGRDSLSFLLHIPCSVSYPSTVQSFEGLTFDWDRQENHDFCPVMETRHGGNPGGLPGGGNICARPVKVRGGGQQLLNGGMYLPGLEQQNFCFK